MTDKEVLAEIQNSLNRMDETISRNVELLDEIHNNINDIRQ